MDEEANRRFLSRSSAYYKLPTPAPTRDFHFVMLPRMTMLAFSATVEPLRIANQLTGECLYRWYLLTEDGQTVRCSNAVSIMADGAIGETNHDDVVFICSGVDGYLAASEKTIAWLRAQARHGRTVGGICTGAFSLARAGLLEGKRFTLHWENHHTFQECFPDLPIADELFYRDGNIITCGGGSACVDMMVSLIEEHHGSGLAMKVLEICLSDPRHGSKHQRLSVSAEIGDRHPGLVGALNDMREHFAEDLNITQLARKHKISRRQLERQFREKIRVSPAQKLREIRLAHAKSLLAETDLTIIEIAFASGFRSLNSFRNSFRQEFNALPTARHWRHGKTS